MADEREAAFVPLDQYVRADSPPTQTRGPEASSASPDPAAPAMLLETLREVRLFRAALADAFDAALADLLRDFAADVLARELVSAPAQIERIAARAIDRFADDEPLRVLAHADDVAALGCLSIPVVADTELRRGDVAIVLRHGTIDLSLGVRLAHALASQAPS